MIKSYKRKISLTIVYILLSIICVVYFFPFLWMVLTALKPSTQIFIFPPEFLPKPPEWSNFYMAATAVPFFTYLRNTSFVAGLAMIGVLFSCPLAAYSLARIKWKGRGILFAITIGVMMIPTHVTMIPLFIIFTRAGLVGTHWPLIIPSFFGVPFYIFLMRQFFRGLPKSLEDAARIDGASEFQIYRRIMFPLCQPSLLAIGLFQVMSSWNDFLAPMIYLNRESMYTLQLGLQQFGRGHETQWAWLMAASAMVTLPVITLYFFVQKSFIRGITFGGVKG